MKKMLKSIWRLLPGGMLKNKIHCLLYKGEGFSFAFRNGVFVTNGPNGIHFLTNEPPFNLIIYFKRFLKHYSVKTGDTLIDAGAYNGHVTILFSQLVGPSGNVVSFEPDPANHELCTQNMKLNSSTNITLVDKGLWLEDTVLEFNSNNSVASSVFYQADDAQKIQIKVTSIDHFLTLNNLTNCHYVKMNIEGSEIMALNGASETIKKFRPSFAITTDHTVDGKGTTEAVEGILKSYECKVWTEMDGSAKITYAN